MRLLTFELEGEVVRQVTALMVTTEEEQSIGVPYFEGPEVQHTLDNCQCGAQWQTIRGLTSMLK